MMPAKLKFFTPLKIYSSIYLFIYLLLIYLSIIYLFIYVDVESQNSTIQ